MSALPTIAPATNLVPSVDQTLDPDAVRRQRGLAIAADRGKGSGQGKGVRSRIEAILTDIGS